MLSVNLGCPNTYDRYGISGRPVHMLSWNSLPVLRTIFFPNHWLLSHVTIVKTMDSGEMVLNPDTMTIVSTRKVCEPRLGSSMMSVSDS